MSFLLEICELFADPVCIKRDVREDCIRRVVTCRIQHAVSSLGVRCDALKVPVVVNAYVEATARVTGANSFLLSNFPRAKISTEQMPFIEIEIAVETILLADDWKLNLSQGIGIIEIFIGAAIADSDS